MPSQFRFHPIPCKYAEYDETENEFTPVDGFVILDQLGSHVSYCATEEIANELCEDLNHDGPGATVTVETLAAFCKGSPGMQLNSYLIEHLADALAAADARFDRERFLEASCEPDTLHHIRTAPRL